VTRTRHLAWALGLAAALWSPAASPSPHCHPTNRFVVVDGGFVRDTLTKLVWQRDQSDAMMWEEAKSYCATMGPGYRLPTVKELLSLVDLSVNSPPKINQTAFPNTWSDYYWTSSPRVGTDNYWRIDFTTGELGASLTKAYHTVRCVR
jgi:hypothetical protein